MKKIVPDPPLDLSTTTAHSVFGNCQAGHSPLFAVCSGVAAHDALVHASLYLGCAYDTGYKAFDDIDPANKGFLWSTLHSVEMAKGLVDALLDGIEERVGEKPLTTGLVGAGLPRDRDLSVTSRSRGKPAPTDT